MKETKLIEAYQQEFREVATKFANLRSSVAGWISDTAEGIGGQVKEATAIWWKGANKAAEIWTERYTRLKDVFTGKDEWVVENVGGNLAKAGSKVKEISSVALDQLQTIEENYQKAQVPFEQARRMKETKLIEAYQQEFREVATKFANLQICVLLLLVG
jgi:hypothetical protein